MNFDHGRTLVCEGVVDVKSITLTGRCGILAFWLSVSGCYRGKMLRLILLDVIGLLCQGQSRVLIGLRLLLILHAVVILATRRRCYDLLVDHFIVVLRSRAMSIRYKFVGEITSQGSLCHSSKVRKISTDVLVLLCGSRTGALVFLLGSGCE